ncbi:eukaryotic translation initiation factor 3 subunit B-like [Dorcoceras hygrometricum]|uniref:Eukaryotic translation initiation factor 3 subunit B-like n=1 Tax=Dorcoceras hygrometricum TaxID=472368 RepID=A0A2Z7D5N0_9LAMI|nr:eukaryotic translation initiation factor 3 subunit B-like [Dorcoceras hygrometricum]
MGFGSGPTGPGPTDEHSFHLHHRDFTVTPIANQIAPIDTVFETEYNYLKNHFSEPQCKKTVLPLNSGKPRTCVTLNGSGIQLAVGPQPLPLRNHNSGLAQRIMVKHLATSPHDPLGITDIACKNKLVVVSVHAQRIMVKHLATSPHDPLGITDIACKNKLVVVSVQYGPFNPYIPITSTTIGKSRVAIDPIATHTSWRSNSDIASVTRVSMTFRVVRTNQYNQDLGLIHSTNGNHLESPNEGSSIDHQIHISLSSPESPDRYYKTLVVSVHPISSSSDCWSLTGQILVRIPRLETPHRGLCSCTSLESVGCWTEKITEELRELGSAIFRQS